MRCTLLKTCLCFLFLFFFSVVTAQTFTDVVHLKNGTVVRGIIIEQVPGKTIKIQTADALKVEINYSDIEKISKETSITSKETSILSGSSHTSATSPSAARQKESKKYFFTAGVGFITGDVIGYTGRVSVGLRLGSHFDLQAFYQLSESDKGLTGDAENEKYGRFSMQNYGVKGSFTLATNGAIHPYFSIGTGYGRSPRTYSGRALQEDNGGIGGWYGYYQSYFINPAFGIAIPIGKNNRFFTELNYYHHTWTKTHLALRGVPDYPKPYKTVKYASLLVGVKF